MNLLKHLFTEQSEQVLLNLTQNPFYFAYKKELRITSKFFSHSGANQI